MKQFLGNPFLNLHASIWIIAEVGTKTNDVCAVSVKFVVIIAEFRLAMPRVLCMFISYFGES